jgi:two-component system CheB/CheR fusion protein
LGIAAEGDHQESLELLQKLDGQVDRLTDLIKALLDATRVAEEQLPLQLEHFDLNEMISKVLEDLQRLYAHHRLVFHAGELKLLTADRERLSQVLTNLVTNAVKYSPDGGEVTVTSTDEGDEVTVAVRDQGIGIPEDLQQRVFERFFRIGHTQVNMFPGMGLGLYISAGIAHRHGGTIRVESKPGQGSLFSLRLPYERVPK